MKTVLWISRHNMAPEQLTDLERIMGGPPRGKWWRLRNWSSPLPIGAGGISCGLKSKRMRHKNLVSALNCHLCDSRNK